MASNLNHSLKINEGEPDIVFSEITSFVTNYGQSEIKKLESMSDHVDTINKIADFNRNNTGELTGVPTNLRVLNKRTNGLQGGDLIILAGETSQGKTSLAINIADEAGIENDVHVISMEMTPTQLTGRLIAMSSGINSNKILTGVLNDSEIAELSHHGSLVASKKIWLDDQSSNIEKIIVSIRRRKLIYNTKLVVIDYLQLVSSNLRGSKEQIVADIARRLKNLAMELDIPIILLSQLNRLDGGKGQQPRLSRLRDSGQIEEAADIVIFVHRPEVYGMPELSDGTPSEDMAEIIVAKGRNVGTGMFNAKFNKYLTKFEDYDTI